MTVGFGRGYIGIHASLDYIAMALFFVTGLLLFYLMMENIIIKYNPQSL